MACDGREVAGDTPTLTGNFTDMNDRLEQLMCHLSLLQEYLQSSDNVDRKPDVDILELKNHLLLRYICRILYAAMYIGCLTLPLVHGEGVRAFLLPPPRPPGNFSVNPFCSNCSGCDLRTRIRNTIPRGTQGSSHPLIFTWLPRHL